MTRLLPHQLFCYLKKNSFARIIRPMHRRFKYVYLLAIDIRDGGLYGYSLFLIFCHPSLRS